METLTFSTPSMYGDHHVIEVRRLLLSIPGVQDVYASSYLKTVEITFDPSEVDPNILESTLDKAGYLQDLESPQETGIAAYGQNGQTTYFRHTAAYKQTGASVGFAQRFDAHPQPLVPCPGMDTTKSTMDE